MPDVLQGQGSWLASWSPCQPLAGKSRKSRVLTKNISLERRAQDSPHILTPPTPCPSTSWAQPSSSSSEAPSFPFQRKNCLACSPRLQGTFALRTSPLGSSLRPCPSTWFCDRMSACDVNLIPRVTRRTSLFHTPLRSGLCPVHSHHRGPLCPLPPGREASQLPVPCPISVLDAVGHVPHLDTTFPFPTTSWPCPLVFCRPFVLSSWPRPLLPHCSHSPGT